MTCWGHAGFLRPGEGPLGHHGRILRMPRGLNQERTQELCGDGKHLVGDVNSPASSLWFHF